jgi:hypothetical protein
VASSLPDRFCWTRFGPEAGQTVSAILARKEAERASNGGLFLWGVGNSVRSAIHQLVSSTDQPTVLFSPIKTRPRPEDIAPHEVVIWSAAVGIDGLPYEIPADSRVTSRRTSNRCAHYALVCFSETPLVPTSTGLRVELDALTNLLSGRRLGASQVTSVVARTDATGHSGPAYDVALEARLVEPYFLTLAKPVLQQAAVPHNRLPTCASRTAMACGTLEYARPSEYASAMNELTPVD